MHGAPWLEASQRTFRSRHHVHAMRDRFLGGLFSLSVVRVLFLAFSKPSDASELDASGDGSIKSGSCLLEFILVITLAPSDISGFNPSR